MYVLLGHPLMLEAILAVNQFISLFGFSFKIFSFLFLKNL
jgi:hypothetical protein